MINPEEVELLIVDDDPEFRGTLARRFLKRGYRLQEAAHGEEALAIAERRQFDVAVLDMIMPGMTGLEVLERLKQASPECEIILLTGQASVDSAVRAMKLGAYDYLSKPFPLAELEVLIERAAERRTLNKENRQLKGVLQRRDDPGEMIGQSRAMQAVFRIIEKAGPTNNAILIQGESGTGKELVARALHRQSLRADHPLVVVNCAALPETLLESELFGHEKGAFTGAVATKPGLFELADGGTLFIDEIGEMPGALQAKLLRVLEDGSMRRVGSLKERRVSVRLVAATNRVLADEVRAGRFREDLFYRINVMSLVLPPLRDREGDIPLLVEKFLGPRWTIESDALEALRSHSWPGNVRQLINALERAKIMSDDQTIRRVDLPPEISGLQRSASELDPAPVEPPAGDHLAGIERAHILQILRRELGNKARAARALGVNRRSLYRLIDKYEIQPAELHGAPSRP